MDSPDSRPMNAQEIAEWASRCGLKEVDQLKKFIDHHVEFEILKQQHNDNKNQGRHLR